MRRRRASAGHVLLVNLTSVLLPDVHLHLDGALAALPGFDVENACMRFRNRRIEVSILHPAVRAAAIAGNHSGQGLELPILNMQDLFDCIIVFGSLDCIRHGVADLTMAASRLRKSVIFASNDAETAVTNLALAFRVAGLQIVDEVAVARISIFIRGEWSQVT